MKIVPFTQGTQEWLEWRKTGITATVPGVLLGVNPNKTPWRLWAEMTGLVEPEDLSKIPAVRYGNEHEDDARQCYENKHDDLLMPICGESDQYPWLFASFDGIDNKGCPVELKCTQDKTWNDVKTDGESSRAFILYYVQVQHQILVAEADSGKLVFWRKGEVDDTGLQLDDELIEFTIAKDNELIAKIIEVSKTFNDAVINRIEPEKDGDRDIFKPAGDELEQWKSHSVNYGQIDRQINALKAEIAELEKMRKSDLQSMKDMLAEKGFNRGEELGVAITRYETKGSIDYKSLVQDNNISDETVESYRGKSSLRYRVTVKDDEVPESLVLTDLAEASFAKISKPEQASSMYWQ